MACDVEYAGDVGNPGAVSFGAVAVVGPVPRLLGDERQRLGNSLADSKSDGVGEVSALFGEPVQEAMRATGRIGADHDLLPGPPQGGQRLAGAEDSVVKVGTRRVEVDG